MQRATLRRFKEGKWTLEFVGDESLTPDFKDDLIIQVDDKEYSLTQLTEIQVSSEFLPGWSETDRDYIHWLTGDRWQEI